MAKEVSKALFEGGSPTRGRVITLGVAVALALLLLVMLQAASRPAYAAMDLLPDLRMARLQNLQIQSTADGRKLLRFDSISSTSGTAGSRCVARALTPTPPR